MRQVIDLFDPFQGTTDARGGRVVSETGRPLQIRDSRNASTRFSLNQQTWHHVPKPKFLFWVRFFGNFSFARTENSTGKDQSYARGISFLVKSVDKPSITPKVEELNQYNKKRLIHTGVSLEPVTMKFHDDTNDDAMAFWIDYFQWYFATSRGKYHPDWAYDAVSGPGSFFGKDWGFAPRQNRISDFENFYLSHVEIYSFFGGRVSQIDLVNPKIIKFDHDNQDYAESQTLGEISLTLDYEGVLYPKLSEELSSLDRPTVSDLLLDLGDYYQLPQVMGAKELFSQLPNRALQDMATGIIQGNLDMGDIFKQIANETIPLRKDIQKDILNGAYGNLAQFGINSALKGLGEFSFGNETKDPQLFQRSGEIQQAELGGYRQNVPAERANKAQALMASRGTTTGSRGPISGVLDTINSGLAGASNAIMGGIDSAVTGVGGAIGSAAATVGNAAAESFGSALAWAASDEGLGIDALATRDRGGINWNEPATGLTNQGVKALNAVASGAASYARNDARSIGTSITKLINNRMA